jgi:hypothetical protein
MMNFLDRLFGRKPRTEQPTYGQSFDAQPPQLTDEQALARYRYMLQTAPPETIERAHAEAFAKLTPEQRQMALRQLVTTLPASEQATANRLQADPNSLARLATRAEIRQPGTLERTFSAMPGAGMGMGGLMMGNFMSTLAGAFVGSMIAQQFFSPGFDTDLGSGFGGGEEDLTQADFSGDTGDMGDMGSDFGDFGDGFADF